MIYFRNINDIEDYSGKEIWLIMRSVTGNLEKIAKLPNVHVVPELGRQRNYTQTFFFGKRNWNGGRKSSTTNIRHASFISFLPIRKRSLNYWKYIKEKIIRYICAVPASASRCVIGSSLREC